MTTDKLLQPLQEVAAKPRSRRSVLKALGLGLTLPAAAAALSACGAPAAPETAAATHNSAETAHTEAAQTSATTGPD